MQGRILALGAALLGAAALLVLLLHARPESALALRGACASWRDWATTSTSTTTATPEQTLAWAAGAEAEADGVWGAFLDWARAHGKDYGRDRGEWMRRFRNFKDSLRVVREHTARHSSGGDESATTYTLGMTKFADMTHEEFMQELGMQEGGGGVVGQECSATEKRVPVAQGGRPEPAPHVQQQLLGDRQLPARVDWREKGWVSPVKNQGHCGSCWTFSTTGALEAHWKKKTGRDVSLSEQQLLDCALAYDNHGCNGGLPSHAFQYILENGGLDTEAAYPYETAQADTCRFRPFRVGARVRGVVNITQFDEHELLEAVGLVGPVSVAFQVASDFRLYTGGVYSSTVCGNQPMDVNHAVLAVGYDTSVDGVPYWIIKNSWGTGWGVNGYFWMKRGENMCGVATCASYPLV